MKKRKNISFRNIVLKILYIIIVICILCNVLFLINTTISKKEYFSLFGISLFSMENDSMESKITKNDLVIANENGATEKELQIGDIIVYSRNSQIKISEIINIKNIDGKIQYITKATNNYNPDNEPVRIGQIIGKVQSNIPFLGLILKILGSRITTGLFIILLIVRFVYNRYTYKMRVNRKKKKMKANI